MNFLFMKIFNKKEAKWYFYFGLGATFIATGALWIFNHYAKLPQNAAKGIESEFPMVAGFLFLFGIATFLITKIYYEKTKVKK